MLTPLSTKEESQSSNLRDVPIRYSPRGRRGRWDDTVHSGLAENGPHHSHNCKSTLVAEPRPHMTLLFVPHIPPDLNGASWLIVPFTLAGE